MKNHVRLVVLLFASIALFFNAMAQETNRIYLSGTDKDHTVLWDFYCTKGMNSGKWAKIAVPSNWELQGFGKYSYGHDNKKADTKADEIGTYKHAFKVPPTYKNQRVFIIFEGVMTDTEVKINGQLAGEPHQGGFYQFQYDITNLVKPNDNLLEVKVSKESANRSIDVAERHGDFWALGGIYRPVYLDIVPQNFIQRIAIDAKANGDLLVDVFSLKTMGNQQLEAQVQTLLGENIGTPFTAKTALSEEKTTLKQTFKNVNLWNAETPNLYQLKVSLKDSRGLVHSLTQRFGFRTIEVRKSDGIYVNGQKVMLRGCNRHTFVAETGRTTSKDVSINDIKLIQEMNMNAVRMSHYPPDAHFLDACDSLGLYVMDELTGWQNKYDTLVGRKLVKEVVVRDVNHPSVLFWDNGNEGGWNRALDGDYDLYDPQKRPVFHPWERFNGFDSKHYITYNYLANSALYDSDILMPTEFMHGLYDGGHGAGLDDFWDLMLKHPHCSGGFLWSFADEGVVRTDKNGVVDCSDNNAPDGILGPHHEKEGSFYAIKEIWSPIRIMRKNIPLGFDGKLDIENHYSFTNLNQCTLKWQLVTFPKPSASSLEAVVNQTGTPLKADIAAGGKGQIQLNLSNDWAKNDALYLTINDPNGREIFTWSWAIPSEKIPDNATSAKPILSAIVAKDEGAILMVKAGAMTYSFDKKTGYLASVNNSKSTISLSNGPTLAGINGLALQSFNHAVKSDKTYTIEANYGGENKAYLNVKWQITEGGTAELTYQYGYPQREEFDFMGITFNYPEANIIGMKWLGEGPYRVWKNRLKGVKYGVWHKDFNEGITGENFIYPEFKGYHADVKWVVVETKEGNFTVYSEDAKTFLQMLTPKKPVGTSSDNTNPLFPTGNIGFLKAISPIGTKFQAANLMGPQSQKNMMLNYTPMKGKLVFDFN
jgi:Glycosyl hydrolases family 2, TIM barrel domain/Glycosyl hydrolases family 2, sugar binding domain/Glycosyl hydrolases family 2/Beta galactosidase small chain